MSEKQIVWRKADELELWGDNPNEGDVGAILQSINQFGYNAAIALWHDRIQGGNHTRIAVGQLWAGGWQPTARDTMADVDADGDLVIGCIDVSHLQSEQEANAFGIALNKTARLGQDDEAKLAALLQDIQAVDERLLIASGFDGDDLDNLLRDLGMADSPIDKNAKPNPRNLPIDMIFTIDVLWGVEALIAKRAGWIIGTQSTQKESDKPHSAVYTPERWEYTLKVEFVDNNYFNYIHDKHVEVVQLLAPKYATVCDVMTPAQCRADGIVHHELEQILDWAEELREHAENVIVIPKYDCLDKIPEYFMLGYSVPTSHGGTPLPPESFRGRRVHLLGGSWKAQLAHMAILRDDVVSIDNNQIMLLATKWGQYVDGEGESMQVQEVLPYVNNVRTVALAISIGAIGAKVNELFPSQS